MLASRRVVARQAAALALAPRIAQTPSASGVGAQLHSKCCGSRSFPRRCLWLVDLGLCNGGTADLPDPAARRFARGTVGASRDRNGGRKGAGGGGGIVRGGPTGPLREAGGLPPPR